MNTLFKRSLIATAIAVSLTACGGSSNSSGSGGSDGSGDNAQTGVFLDSAVGGISYKTESQEGKTSANGEYKFKPGETVTFSIGGLTLPPVTALGVITPRDIGSAEVATRIAQILQSLDSDNDPTNGITLNDAVHAAASGLGDLDLASATFLADNSASLASLMAASGSGRTDLVSASDANAHLDSTIVASLPTKFSTAWLANRTLYSTWYGDGYDSENDTDLTNVPVVEKVVFNSAGTHAVITDILNSEDYEVTISINSDGYLHEADDNYEGERIACGSTKDYIQTHYVDEGKFDSVDRWYFDKDKAVAAANNQSAGFPIHACEITAKAISNPHTPADLNGRTIYGVWFEDENNAGDPIDETAVIVKETYNNGNVNIENIYGSDVGLTESLSFTVEGGLLKYEGDASSQGSKIICSNTQYFKAHWMDGSSMDSVDYWFFDEFSARSYVNALEEEDNLVNADTTCDEQ